MEIKPIKSELDYKDALQRMEVIFSAKPGTEEGDELEILGLLIEQYEEANFPFDLPDPIEAIMFRMDQMNLNQRDLTKIIGSKSRASEIMNRKDLFQSAKSEHCKKRSTSQQKSCSESIETFTDSLRMKIYVCDHVHYSMYL